MSSAPSTPRPLILFDGVCNLCNGAVTFIIRRDPGARFAFVPLQSQAAQHALLAAHAPQPLPDSIVLIDSAGVHTHSTAALRIARGMRFPWPLLAVLLLLPRFCRDPAYRYIARNRYRWFGQRDACMLPTPELKARFLADAPPVAPPRADTAQTLGSQPPAATPVGTLATFGQRFLMAYLLVYLFPFPLNIIPAVEALTSPYTAFLHTVVPLVGRHVFDVTITVFPNGSGDTTYNYVELLVFFVLALLISVGWSLLGRGQEVSSRSFGLWSIYLRAYLAASMLSYGFAKVIPLQMPFPGPDRLIGTIGDMSPMGLVWTFLGASPAYQVFAGLSELLGGLLLLFRRTSLLGAIVSAAVMLNVVMLNFCYDIPVKIYSSHLLLISLLLVAPHLPRLLAFLFLHLPVQPPPQYPHPVQGIWPSRIYRIGKGLFILLVVFAQGITTVVEYRSERAEQAANADIGIYRIESFTHDGVSDRDLADAQRWVRVGLGSWGVGAIQRADGTSQRLRMELNDTGTQLTIAVRNAPDSATLNVTRPQPGLLLLEGTFEGKPLTARLRRDDTTAPLLTTRGFHWINEYPLNR